MEIRHLLLPKDFRFHLFLKFLEYIYIKIGLFFLRFISSAPPAGFVGLWHPECAERFGRTILGGAVERAVFGVRNRDSQGCPINGPWDAWLFPKATVRFIPSQLQDR